MIRMSERIELLSEEFRELQAVVDQRSAYEPAEFKELADKQLQDLVNANFDLAMFSIGFLVRPNGEIHEKYRKPLYIARVEEDGVIDPNFDTTYQRNHYHSLFGFRAVYVADGWLPGIMFRPQSAPGKNTIFVPKKTKIELIASGSTVDGKRVTLNKEGRDLQNANK